VREDDTQRDMRMTELEAEKMAKEAKLLANIVAHREELENLLAECSGKWGYEDPIYRFYHQSFKVYALQERTQQIVEKLQALAPGLPLNKWFLEIVRQGTGKEFTMEDNENWTATTRPMVEAFFHARFFLEMICKYGKKLAEPPLTMPSGWAAVLYLYNLR
jgi:hypothetical protein